MKIPIYQIDSFTQKLFGGNPAAICHLPYWLSDETLQNIAIENNLAETGFLLRKTDSTKSGGLCHMPKLTFAGMQRWRLLM